MNFNSTPWLELVLQLAMGSTIVLAAGLFTILMLHRQSSATKHLAGTLTCIALMIFPVAVTVLPSWRLGLLQLTSTRPVPSGSIVNRATKFSQAAFTPAMFADTAITSESTSTPSEFHSDVVRSPESPKSQSLVVCLFGLYLLGVTYGLLRLVVDHVLAWRLTANSREFPHNVDASIVSSTKTKTPRIRIRASEHVSVPMVTGLLRPTILLPGSASAWPADQVRSAIAHEFAHVERHDLAVQLMANVIAIVYWPQPLVHLLMKIMRMDRETACDDKALESGQQRTDYARHLLDVASELCDRNRDRTGVLAMARNSNVEKRINAVLSQSRRRSRPDKSVVAWMLVSILASLFGSAWISPFSDNDSRAFAQEKAAATPPADVLDLASDPGEEPYRASGRVVDINGKPVAGALVVAPVYTKDMEVETVIQTTNDDGEFELIYPVNARSSEEYHTWAYADGHAIRVVMMKARFGESRQAENVEIELPKTEVSRYRVLLPDGTPCTDAVVGPDSMDFPNGFFAADESTGLSGSVPDQIFDKIIRRPDRSGNVTFENIPRALLKTITVSTSRYGKQEFSSTRDTTLRLRPAGEIRGNVVVESPDRFAGTKVMIQTRVTAAERDLLEMGHGQGIAEVELDAEGKFHVPAIAAGRILPIWMAWDEGADQQPLLDDSHVVRPGKVLNLSIETRPAVTLSGQVLFEDTRQPAIGARVYMRNLKSPLGGNYSDADEQGRFSILVPAGMIHRQVTSLGQNESVHLYDHPRLDNLEVPSGEASIELEPILLKRKKVVRGKLQDTSGNPINGATVVLHSGSFRHLNGSAETNADGKFEIAVRDWKILQEIEQVRDRTYWAVLELPAYGVRGPVYTRLRVKDENPDAVVLEKP